MRFVSWKVESESGTELSAPDTVDQDEEADWETGNRIERREDKVDEEEEEEVLKLEGSVATAEAEAFTEEEVTEGEGEADAVADSVVTNEENLDLVEEEDEGVAEVVELVMAADALEDPPWWHRRT